MPSHVQPVEKTECSNLCHICSNITSAEKKTDRGASMYVWSATRDYIQHHIETQHKLLKFSSKWYGSLNCTYTAKNKVIYPGWDSEDQIIMLCSIQHSTVCCNEANSAGKNGQDIDHYLPVDCQPILSGLPMYDRIVLFLLLIIYISLECWMFLFFNVHVSKILYYSICVS